MVWLRREEDGVGLFRLIQLAGYSRTAHLVSLGRWGCFFLSLVLVIELEQHSSNIINTAAQGYALRMKGREVIKRYLHFKDTMRVRSIQPNKKTFEENRSLIARRSGSTSLLFFE